MSCRQEEHHHVTFRGEGGGEAVDKARLLARTQSAPLRPRGSMKGCSQSPTRQELQAFETLLDGTGAQMPNRSQLLATLSTARYHSLLIWSLPSCIHSSSSRSSSFPPSACKTLLPPVYHHPIISAKSCASSLIIFFFVIVVVVIILRSLLVAAERVSVGFSW